MRFLGLAFDIATLDQAARLIAERPPAAPFAYVVTPNADHLVRVARDPALLGIYAGASLCLLDSRVVCGLARLLGVPAPPVVTGSDLTELLLRRHLLPDERITIVGMHKPDVARLAQRLALKPPAHHEPPKGFETNPEAFDAAIAFVRAHPSRYIFLAVGSPRQELLAAALAAGGITGTALCIGASLEFLAETRRRAPLAVRRLGLEWLFRLLCEPRRLWRRYLLRCPAIIGLLLAHRLGGSTLR